MGQSLGKSDGCIVKVLNEVQSENSLQTFGTLYLVHMIEEIFDFTTLQIVRVSCLRIMYCGMSCKKKVSVEVFVHTFNKNVSFV